MTVQYLSNIFPVLWVIRNRNLSLHSFFCKVSCIAKDT